MPKLDEAEERIAARVAEILNAHDAADEANDDAEAAEDAAEDAAEIAPGSDAADAAEAAADTAEAAADAAEAAAADGDLDAAEAAADDAEAAREETFEAVDDAFDETITEAAPTAGDPPAPVEALAEQSIAEQLDAVTAVEDTGGVDPEQPELRGLPRFWFKPLTRSNR